MYDRSAGKAAARAVLESAPVIEGAEADGPIVDLGALVDAVVRATNPDALVVPTYDAMLAQAARYRLEQDPEGGPPGAKMSITAHPGAVALGVYSGSGETLVAGLVAVDAAWLTCLALGSAAMEAKRLRGEGQGDHGSE